MDAPAHARIILLEHGVKIDEFFMSGELLTIGRETGNDIRLNYTAISRFHAQIILDKPDRYRIKDLDSRNGTVVNNERINQELRLKNNDRIQLGRYTLIFMRLVDS
ncbi:MAG: FHA domain-containing protein [Magnetococcales bacterium]|nr:FHA domain-containing protein [Magnetococcales bacterium]NGZ06009.1 FHA domain-containing protein [Magnetococcales bacterium]